MSWRVLIAQGISEPLGQPVIVDNRAGIVAVDTVIKATPDGYIMLFYGPTAWLLPLLRNYASWDPVKDFASVTQATRAPNILVVHPSMPVKSVKDLIALSNLMFPDSGVASPHIKSGRVRAMAVTSAEPSALAPRLPTVAASGLPGYASEIILGMFAPAGTPMPLINRINKEIVQVLNSAQVKDKFFNVGVEPVGSSPEHFAATVKSEIAKWGKVIKDANIREE